MISHHFGRQSYPPPPPPEAAAAAADDRSSKKVTMDKNVEETMTTTNGERPPLFVLEDNPIMNPLVLDLVFDLLNLAALKNCRLINSKWGEPATRKMLTISTLSIDAEDSAKLCEMESALMVGNSQSKFQFRHITMDKITHTTYPKIWPLLGPHVRSFIISHWWDDSAKDLTLTDYEDLLLTRCPCLEELVLPSTKFFKKAKNFLLCTTTAKGSGGGAANSKLARRQISLNLKILKVKGIARPDVRFWRIISVSPNLISLHIECHLVEEFWNPHLPQRTMWIERMSNLRELEVRSYANEGATGTSVRYFLSIPWSSLTKFTYECYDLSETMLRETSEHLKQTLEYLRVALFNKKYQPWPADLRGDWMTSHMLTKLRHFGLEIDEHCEGPIFCRTLVLSMFIPNLETLTLTMYDDGENCAEWSQGLFHTIYTDCMTTCGHDDPNNYSESDSEVPGQNQHNEILIQRGQGQRLEFRREKMRRLVLPPKMTDTSFILPVLRVYPNLRDLQLERPCPQVVSAILIHWRQLERLTLSLSLDDEFCVGVNWNWILTGLQVVQPQEGHVMQPMAFFNGASIVNLQRLTSLDIKMVSKSKVPDPTLMLLNDVLIYNGLAHLTAIQRIAIEGQMFSNEAVTFLKSHLLPFCNLQVERGDLLRSSSFLPLQQQQFFP